MIIGGKIMKAIILSVLVLGSIQAFSKSERMCLTLRGKLKRACLIKAKKESVRSIASTKKFKVKSENKCIGKTLSSGYVGHCANGSKGFFILEINKKLHTFKGVKRGVYKKFLRAKSKKNFYKKYIQNRYPVINS